jgi:hypothetical protein
MFAATPKLEFAIRRSLIAAILFNAPSLILNNVMRTKRVL